MILKKSIQRVACLLCGGLFLGLTAASALVYKTPQELYQQSDLVVTGEVIEIDQDMDTTTIQFKIKEVLKGSPQTPHVTIKTAGGRVYLRKDQPQFLQIEKYLLFLKSKGAYYLCLNDADGQKIIRNDNIYPYAGNMTLSQPLEDYLKSLPKPTKAA